VEQTIKDRLQKEKELDLAAGKLHLFILAYKGAFALLQSIRSTESLKTPQRVIDALKEFIDVLKKLEATDLSADWRYCQKLSKAWNEVLTSLDGAKFPTTSLEELVSSVNHFPEKGDHSLGYYLSLEAGEEWIPFPFMEILRNLHENRAAIQQLLRKGEIALRSLI